MPPTGMLASLAAAGKASTLACGPGGAMEGGITATLAANAEPATDTAATAVAANTTRRMDLLSMMEGPPVGPRDCFPCASRHYRGGKRLLLRAFGGVEWVLR